MAGINHSVMEKVSLRMEARRGGDYELADKLKDEIEAEGYFVRDFGPRHTEVGPKDQRREFDCVKCGNQVQTHHPTIDTCATDCGLRVVK